MELQPDFNLNSRWLVFLEDYVATLLDPTLGQGGEFITNVPLFTLFDYGLQGALLSMLEVHNTTMIFTAGLPVMPHDVGYDLWTVEISPRKIECLVVVGHNQRLSKVSKKTRRFNEITLKNDAFEGLRQFRLPITVRFEGGQQTKRK